MRLVKKLGVGAEATIVMVDAEILERSVVW